MAARYRDIGSGVMMPLPVIACGPGANPWAIMLHDLVCEWADEWCGSADSHVCDRAGRTLALTSSDGVRWLYRFKREQDARHAFAGYAAALSNGDA